jgi:hypothetical protein
MSSPSVSPLLRKVVQNFPAYDARKMWDETVEELSSARFRGEEASGATEAFARLRAALRGEVVAFHKLLYVVPEGDGAAGARKWRVSIPLTLFPKRDHGFVSVECAVEFEGRGGEFRVLEALPLDKSDTLAEASMGAELQVEASGKVGAPIALAAGNTVASASVKVYGSAKTNFDYTVKRATVVCEVLHGTGALWRLENPARPEEVAAESHSLEVILETAGDCTLSAAAYLKAASEVQWLSSSVGRIIANLGDTIRRFFGDGAPVEAYGQWADILPKR